MTSSSWSGNSNTAPFSRFLTVVVSAFLLIAACCLVTSAGGDDNKNDDKTTTKCAFVDGTHPFLWRRLTQNGFHG
jgi:hypothetical protein